MSKIHIAGFPVQIGSRYRQRCAWCEEILIDGDMANEMVATSDGGRAAGPGKYELGALVEVTKNGPVTGSAVVPHQDGDQLPAYACVGPPKLRVVPDQPTQHECDHGITFDMDAARKLLDEAVGKPQHPDLGVAFVLGSSATDEIRRRWPRGWFTAEMPCPKGCGYVGIAYASYEHYLMGDW